MLHDDHIRDRRHHSHSAKHAEQDAVPQIDLGWGACSDFIRDTNRDAKKDDLRGRSQDLDIIVQLERQYQLGGLIDK